MQKTLKSTLQTISNMASNKAFVIVPAFTFAIALVITTMYPTGADAAVTNTTTATSSSNQSTYIVDLTGQGCGNNCADFYQFLSSNGISLSSSNSTGNGTNINTNTGTGTRPVTATGTSTRPGSYQYVNYPYQVYTYFPTTNLGGNSINGVNNMYGSNAGFTQTSGTPGPYNSGYSTGTTGTYGTNYTLYPYQTYTYYQNPSQKYDSYSAGQYPDPVYTYYGTSANGQVNKQKVNEFNPYTYAATQNQYASQYGNSYYNGSYGVNSQTYYPYQSYNYDAGSNSGSGFTITR